MKWIHGAEDFGLGINCMTRLYARDFEESVLDDILLAVEQYKAYLSIRTIVCSLRELVGENSLWGEERDIPPEQKGKYEKLLKTLVRQGLTLEKRKSQRKDENDQIVDFGRHTYFIDYYREDGKQWTKEEFLKWVKENNLNHPAPYIELENSDGNLPIKDSFLQTFFQVCYDMVQYSYGRHTYMPSTCRSFVHDNIILISDKNLQVLIDYLQGRNADRPKEESISDRIDSETWQHMLVDLQGEMMNRRTTACRK